MESKILISNRYKKMGWLLFILSVTIYHFVYFTNNEFNFLNIKTFAFVGSELLGKRTYFGFIKVNLTYTILALMYILGVLLLIFSKEKVEDEYVQYIRLSSFQWSFLINFIFLFFTFVFVFGIEFLNIMIYSMFLMPVIYLLRFNYLIFKSKNEK